MPTAEAIPPRRAPAVRWTEGVRNRFLDTLAATCDIAAAAAAIGVAPTRIYTRRRRDAAFAARWDEALQLGYQALELGLVGHALAHGPRDAAAAVDRDRALKLLVLHDARRAGRRAAVRHATREETETAILRKLARIATHAASDA